ncbi:uncharacterized protein N7498_001611 [Penicillium cinerascens]|uniref:Uncharacterized protein n=1 Tax=Penicillium cinerascens TaxID=70096 RepID=A0A9W9N8G3_9EURO|nr:uncharacterized protein N7498_001611 [Penicillium cinerascens]KAJ5215204.1 hypothetical protein N7498_001611 [Penicillium cinerascens]
MAFISRTTIKRDLRFNESDLFDDDDIMVRKEEFRCFTEYFEQWQAESGDLNRIVEVTRRLNNLGHEKVGSIALEMTYLFQFHCYQQYRSGNEILYEKHARLYDIILEQLYANEWFTLDEKTRSQRRYRIANQIKIGRRWSICVSSLPLSPPGANFPYDVDFTQWLHFDDQISEQMDVDVDKNEDNAITSANSAPLTDPDRQNSPSS